mmetsp:Transcript_14733/g.55762  ORF Transcript_14733/g.55762 Transcript_14733/m.55762 type:complete len:564 (-) Transcript_14733:55-1746(-)
MEPAKRTSLLTKKKVEGVMRDYEGAPSPSSARLKFATRDPIVLNCPPSSEWRTHPSGTAELVRTMADAWRKIHNTDALAADLTTMPELCMALFRAVEEFQEKALLEPADEARAKVKEIVREDIGELSDAAVDALLAYMERCGLVLLKFQQSHEDQHARGVQKVDAVIWNPTWFCSTVLGEFFKPEEWGGRVLRDLSMDRRAVRDVLSGALGNIASAMNPQARTKILEMLVDLMGDMDLCACIKTADQEEEIWIPTLFHSLDRTSWLCSDRGAREGGGGTEDKEDMSGKELLCRSIPSLRRDGRWEKGNYHGYILSLKDLRRNRGRTSWSIFPPGSFSRFMVRVVKAFPCPEKRGISLTLQRNSVKLQYGSEAFAHCQMLHDEKGIAVAWMMWVWARNDQVDGFIVTDEEEPSRYACVLLQVLRQFGRWMRRASTIQRMGPEMFEYDLHSEDAFLESGKTILDSGKGHLSSHQARASLVPRCKLCSTSGQCTMWQNPTASTLKSGSFTTDNVATREVLEPTRQTVESESSKRGRSSSDRSKISPEKRRRVEVAEEEKSSNPRRS